LFKLNAVIKRQTLNTHTVEAKNISTSGRSTDNFLILVLVMQSCRFLKVI